MKWHHKVAVTAVMLTMVGFAGAKCYNTYFEKEENNVAILKEEKQKEYSAMDDGKITKQEEDKDKEQLNQKQESKGKEEEKDKEQPNQKQESKGKEEETRKEQPNQKQESEGKEEEKDKEQPNQKQESKGKEEETRKEKLDVGSKAAKVGESTSRRAKGKEVYSAYGTTPTITVLEGGGTSYLTNKKKGVLVKVEYEGTGDKTIKIGEEDEATVSENSPYQYIFRVADNVDITAKSGSASSTKTIDNIVTVTTGCEVGTGTGYVKDKTYYSAILGGKITGTVAMSAANIKELGVRYWRGDEEDEIYTVKTQDITTHSSSQASGQMVSIGTNSVTYELLARSLKENTTYYMQSYMVNKVGEVLLGDVKEFSTLGHGIGLYGLYYGGNGDITPKLIKQETEPKMTIAVSTEYSKAKWVGEIAPLNSGLMTFKVTSSGSVSVKIGDETLSFTRSGETNKTHNIYSIGQKYPITIEAQGVAGTTVKVEWMEDGGYQEIHKEQLYPKEYVKMESAVINSKGTDNQEVKKSTGEVMKKKVITNGQNISKFELSYDTNNVATEAKVNGSTRYTITGSGATGELVGWLVYNTNGVVEPLTENVATIDYNANKVTLRNGSVWSLYDDVEVVGRLMQLSDRKVYDLGRYISSTGTLSDGKSLATSDLYRVDNVDNTYIVNLYSRETPSYQQALEQYSTMERFVEDAKSVDEWNLAIGEGRLYSIVPLRILLSFDGDGSFNMENPKIQIKKDLFKTKACSDEDTVFKLSLPTDATEKESTGDKITSVYYADWRYMNDVAGDYNREEKIAPTRANVTIREPKDEDYFEIILNDYVTPNASVSDGVALNNIMVNVLLRVDSIAQKTSKEVFDGISASEKIRTGYDLNGSYRAYTKARVSSLNDSGIETDITEIPVEIKIKPQVTFE